MYLSDDGKTLLQVDARDLVNGTFKFPESVTKIGENAFMAAPIRYLEVPKRIDEIGESAFYLCQQLEWVKILGNVRVLNEGLFRACTNLKILFLPPTISYVHRDAFKMQESDLDFRYPCPGANDLSLTGVAIDSFDVDEIERVRQLLPSRYAFCIHPDLRDLFAEGLQGQNVPLMNHLKEKGYELNKSDEFDRDILYLLRTLKHHAEKETLMNEVRSTNGVGFFNAINAINASNEENADREQPSKTI